MKTYVNAKFTQRSQNLIPIYINCQYQLAPINRPSEERGFCARGLCKQISTGSGRA
jgi:hypothetical protein